MAVMNSRDTRTVPAGEDLSTKQFYFVTLESDGKVDLADSAGEQCFGVLLNKPSEVDRPATVVVSGQVTVVSGGTIAAGAAVQTDASGKAITAASGDVVMGYAMESAVANDIFRIELIQGGNVVA
jgi:hypothetical protein